MPAIAALAVLGLVVGVAATGGDKAAPAANAGSALAPFGTDFSADTALTVPQSTAAPVVIETTGLAKTAIDRSLVKGVFGDDVKALQERLTVLGFAPGVADGAFGDQTQQAVWAFEKLITRVPRADATGRVTNEMWQLMQDNIVVQPRRTGAGTHMEIYLPEQVAAVFSDNKATLVMHISSGDGLEWCETVTLDTDEKGEKLDPPVEKAVCGVSKTPGGVFRFNRRVEGDRVGALGRMYNPMYFNYGIAVHGAKEIPLRPVSHGCIRIHRTISDTFQDYIPLRSTVFVWGEDGKEPEHYTKRESTPVFNYPDPNATTTTSTTTTIKSTTTVPATTTVKSTTTVPATTTTKPATPTTVTTQPPVTEAPTTVAPTPPTG